MAITYKSGENQESFVTHSGSDIQFGVNITQSDFATDSGTK